MPRAAGVVESLTSNELECGVGRRYSDFVVVHVGEEIEAGIVLRGRMLPRPGRLGHTSIDRTGRWLCRCGRVGCLAALIDAAERGLVFPAQALPPDLAPAPSAALSYLGLGLVHLVNILNPAAVVLAGPLADATPDARSWLSAAMRGASLPTARAGLVEITRPV